jgi:hypothetical protein
VKKSPAVKLEKHNGVVVPVGKTQSLEELAQTSIETNALSDYDGPALHLYGRTNIDAAIATLVSDAAAGVPEARRELLDRIMGKPLQRQEVKSQNLTLISFLDSVAEKEEGVIDVK